MAARTTAKKKGEEPFEQMLERLEVLVKKLEGGELSLEESLTCYEEGVGLVRRAQGRLDTLDRRLEQLLEDGRTAPLEPPDGVGLIDGAHDGASNGERAGEHAGAHDGEWDDGEGAFDDGLDDAW